MTLPAYPQIPKEIAYRQVSEFKGRDFEELQLNSAILWTMPDVFYTSPAVSRISAEEVAGAGRRIFDIFNTVAGFNTTTGEQGYKYALAFDRAVTKEIHEIFPMSPYEAAQSGVWSFITVRVLPGIAKWRFSKDTEGTIEDRFLGGGDRNTFARLWWRAYFLGPDPCAQLTEDELIQMFERGATIGSNQLILQEIANAAISRNASTHDLKGMKRSAFVSEVGKRIIRTLAAVSIESMPETEARKFIRSIIHEAQLQLGKH